MTKVKYYVIIVGGGPAGLSAGISLLKHTDFSVLLVEKHDYSAQKIGEVVSKSLYSLLEYLDINIKSVVYCESNSHSASWGSEALSVNDFIFNGYGNTIRIDRVQFESVMRDQFIAAGGKILYNSIMFDCKKENLWNISVSSGKKIFHFESHYLINASGRSNINSRQKLFNTDYTVIDNLVGLVAYYTNDTNHNQIYDELLEASSDGWWYTSCLPNKTRVVVFFSDSDIMALKKYNEKENWDNKISSTRYIKLLINKQNSLLQKLKIVSARSHFCKNAISNNLVSIGDASASFDPISSMGICYGIYSGIHGARVINYMSNNQDCSYYENGIKNLYNDYLKNRNQIYQSERRWDREVFWNRRHTTNLSIS